MLSELRLEGIYCKLNCFGYPAFRTAHKVLELAQLKQESGTQIDRQRREAIWREQLLQLVLPPRWVSYENRALMNCFV